MSSETSTPLPTGASRHYVLAAGGTGGHLIPAFALAAELHARGHHVALITDERGANIPGKPDFLTAQYGCRHLGPRRSSMWRSWR